MARLQLGNEVGVTAVDKPDETLLGTVVTDGANSFTVSAADFRNFRVGQVIDVVTKTTGATGAGFLGRTVTALDSATNTVTYSGADATLTTSFGAYLAGQWELAAPAAGSGGVANDLYVNVNGGFGPGAGFNSQIFNSIDAMRARLTAIDSTTYSAAQLDLMTMNDMIYAIRVSDYSGSIK
jgi:hypothetical protein